jgi:two-component system sensor histidine kinase BaeS
MRFKIKYKLFLAFVLTTLVVLLLTAVMMKSSFQRGFLNYINETEAEHLKTIAVKLEQLYAMETNWHFIQSDPRVWHQILRPQPQLRQFTQPESFLPPPPPLSTFFPPPVPPPPEPLPHANSPPPNDPLDINGRISLVDANKNLIIGRHNHLAVTKNQKIVVNDNVVGYLLLEPLRGIEKRIDVSFAQQQTQAIYGIALFGLLIAGGVAMLIAHHMTMPIKRLVSGAQALTSGQFERRIKVNTQDELALLADNFNVLAATLEHNRLQQRQWIADISHELRTPLAILHGEIQAIEDGVREFNASALQSLAAEVTRLNCLIEDLYQLSLSDNGALRYEKTSLDLVALLQNRLAAFAERLQKQHMTLKTQFPAQIRFHGDGQRLGQLFANLLENTLRYTDAGGQIWLHGHINKQGISLNFEDSKPAVPDEAMEKLFDRLYRVDGSRNRNYGGSGLGLAICKNIVQAHGGTLIALHSELGGLQIEIKFPLV